MSNMSKYQNNYWYPLVANYQNGEYCKGCGKSYDSKSFSNKFNGLVIDKINNDHDHTIKNNKVEDFQLLCRSCNMIKNPVRKPDESEMTTSEKTNRRAEKPLMEWLMKKLRNGEKILWSYFVAEGSYKFDISPETIERRYYKKYFLAESSPFALDIDQLENTYIILKMMDKPNLHLDIDPHTPTPSLRN